MQFVARRVVIFGIFCAWPGSRRLLLFNNITSQQGHKCLRINSWNNFPSEYAGKPPRSKQSGEWLTNNLTFKLSHSKLKPFIWFSLCVSARNASVSSGAVWAGWRWGHTGPRGGRGSYWLSRQRWTHIDTQGCSRPPPYSPAGKQSHALLPFCRNLITTCDCCLIVRP